MNEILSVTPHFKIGVFDVYPVRNVVCRNNTDFSLQPRAMEVLCALIESGGDVVSRDTLIEKNWENVYGADESLTRIISLLRKTFREAGASEPYIETISKRGYRVVQPVTRTPEGSELSADMAVTSALADGLLEDVPAGSELEVDDRSNATEIGSIRPWLRSLSTLSGTQKLILVAGIFLTFILALGLWRTPGSPDFITNNPPSQTTPASGQITMSTQIEPSSIGVLPFTDLSPTSDQAYFSDGISEEILNALARVEGLKVASRTSSFQFKGQSSVGIPTIASKLRVRHVLQGSVRKAGDSIRITTQLIDGQTDKHLWASTFDRTLSTENIFAIQEEIATAIVEAIRQSIDGSIGESPPIDFKTGNLDAYESFLRARTLYQNRMSLGEAEVLLSQATTLDSDFTDAWALRSAIYTIAFAYGPAFTENGQTDRVQAGIFAKTALNIDRNNALALATLALADMMDLQEGRGNKTFGDVIVAFDEVLKVHPKSIDALNWRGLQMQRAGFLDLAVQDHARCVTIDQASAACRYNLMSSLAVLGRHAAAERHLYEALNYGAFGQDTLILLILAEMNRRDLFLVASGWHPQLQGWQRFGDLYDALKSPEKDHTELREQLEQTFIINEADNIASDLFLSSLGDEEAAMAGALYWFGTHENVRKTPKFKQDIKDMGIYDYWIERGFPPQCRPVGSNDFECD